MHPLPTFGGQVPSSLRARWARIGAERESGLPGAVGAGEALASAERGSPWRLSVDRATGAVEVSSFANLSRALLPSSASAAASSSSAAAALSWRCVDYSRQALSLDPAARELLARKLLAAGLALEASFGGPQDVEGCLPAGLEEEGRIWIVQARPQPGA